MPNQPQNNTDQTLVKFVDAILDKEHLYEQRNALAAEIDKAIDANPALTRAGILNQLMGATLNIRPYDSARSQNLLDVFFGYASRFPGGTDERKELDAVCVKSTVRLCRRELAANSNNPQKTFREIRKYIYSLPMMPVEQRIGLMHAVATDLIQNNNRPQIGTNAQDDLAVLIADDLIKNASEGHKYYSKAAAINILSRLTSQFVWPDLDKKIALAAADIRDPVTECKHWASYIGSRPNDINAHIQLGQALLKGERADPARALDILAGAENLYRLSPEKKAKDGFLIAAAQASATIKRANVSDSADKAQNTRAVQDSFEKAFGAFQTLDPAVQRKGVVSFTMKSTGLKAAGYFEKEGDFEAALALLEQIEPYAKEDETIQLVQERLALKSAAAAIDLDRAVEIGLISKTSKNILEQNNTPSLTQAFALVANSESALEAVQALEGIGPKKAQKFVADVISAQAIFESVASELGGKTIDQQKELIARKRAELFPANQ